MATRTPESPRLRQIERLDNFEIGRLINFQGRLLDVFDAARPIPDPKPKNALERNREANRIGEGIETIIGETPDGKIIVTSTLEEILGKENLVGPVVSIRKPRSDEVYRLGYEFGRIESVDREEIPQNPVINPPEYQLQAARTRALTYDDMNEIESIIKFMEQNPTKLEYSFRILPFKRSY